MPCGLFWLPILLHTQNIKAFFLEYVGLTHENFISTKTEKHSLALQPKDTLYVNLFPDALQDTEWDFKKNYRLNKLINRVSNESPRFTLSIEKNDAPNSLLEIRASAKGSNEARAQDKAEIITYNWELNEQTLYLERFSSNIRISNILNNEIALN